MKEYYSIVRGEYDARDVFEWVNKTVEGEVIDTVFGIRKEEQGWRITHIPTGFLLVTVYFATFNGAAKFAGMVANLYGDVLNTDSITVIRDTRGDCEEFAQFNKLMNKVNEYEGTVSLEDVMKMGGK